MPALEIKTIPAFNDNYIYLLTCKETEETAIVDPGSASAVFNFLEKHPCKIDKILCTHHHHDHIGGNEAVKSRFHCEIIGFSGDKNRIAGIDKTVEEGDFVQVGKSQGRVIETPGHTSGHISYYFEDSQALFCADTIFSGGCGRLFEGTAAQMHDSCQKLAQLPNGTKVFFAHEYTLNNLKFALSVEPNNPKLQEYLKEVEKTLEKGAYTSPSTIEREKQINPFLRCDEESIRHTLSLKDASSEEVFRVLRARKDSF